MITAWLVPPSRQRERLHRTPRRPYPNDGSSHCMRHLLQHLQCCTGLEICTSRGRKEYFKLRHPPLPTHPPSFPVTRRHNSPPSKTVCDVVITWEQLRAFEESQKYKVGKFVIEKANMRKLDWDTT